MRVDIRLQGLPWQEPRRLSHMPGWACVDVCCHDGTEEEMHVRDGDTKCAYALYKTGWVSHLQEPVELEEAQRHVRHVTSK